MGSIAIIKPLSTDLSRAMGEKQEDLQLFLSEIQDIRTSKGIFGHQTPVDFKNFLCPPMGKIPIVICPMTSSTD